MLTFGLKQAMVFFAFAVTLHMLEEVVWLPAWSQQAGKWHVAIGTRAFGFASAVFLLLLIILTLLAPTQPLALAALCGLACVMVLNLFLPHLGAALDQRRYAPGLLTSLLLVVPSAVALLVVVVGTQALPWSWLAVGVVGMIAISAVGWPALMQFAIRHFDPPSPQPHFTQDPSA